MVRLANIDVKEPEFGMGLLGMRTTPNPSMLPTEVSVCSVLSAYKMRLHLLNPELTLWKVVPRFISLKR